MTDQHRETALVIYQPCARHTRSTSVACRLHSGTTSGSLAQQLVERLGLERELYAQAEDRSDTAMVVPVEQMWERERRNKGVGPARRWREVQLLRSKYLPTARGFAEFRYLAAVVRSSALLGGLLGGRTGRLM